MTPFPIDQRRGLAARSLLLLAAGLIGGVVLIVVVASIERSTTPEAPSLPAPDVTELVELAPLSIDDITGSGVPLADATFEVPDGGWIQITDDAGRLAQQYRFARLDPDPPGLGPGWIALEAPELEIFLDDGRVVRLNGDHALALAPNRLLESGTMQGDVRIELQEPTDDGSFVTTLVVRTPDARFDNILGEIRCDESIALETPGGAFLGRTMKLLYNDQADLVELLQVDEVEVIRLAAAPREPAGAEPTPESGAASPAQIPVTSPSAPGATARRTRDDSSSSSRSGSPSPAAPPAPVFLLTLTDNVRVEQGPRTSTGDRMELLFTSQSRGLATHVAVKTPCAPVPQHPVPRTQLLLAMALAATAEDGIAPPAHPEDTLITCSGPLVLVPAPAGTRPLASPDDARLELFGAPVELADPETQVTASGAKLSYHVARDRLELAGDGSWPLTLERPDLSATADVLWFTRQEQQGGLMGVGHATIVEGKPPPVAEPRPERRLDLAWRDGLELHFAENPDTGDLQDLRQIIVRGDVDARSASLDSTVDTLVETPRAGHLTCAHLVVDVKPGDAGGLVAERMTARGRVTVADTTQSLRAETLVATFGPTDDTEPETRIEAIDARGSVALERADGVRVFADRVEADAARSTARLTGKRVVIIDGANIIDETQAVTIDEANGRYVVEGPGRFRHQADENAPREPGLGDDALVVTWTDGVVVAADPQAPDTHRIAMFRGAIAIDSPELALEHADTLVARFPADGGSLEQLDAAGNVVVRSVGEPGVFRADDLRVDFIATAGGDTVPVTLVARGHVRAANDTSTLWADALTVAFAEAGTGDGDAFAGARTQVTTIEASGGVQLARAEGERVFAERLEADAQRDFAELFGARIVVVSDTFAIDRATHVVLDRSAGQYRIDGSGVFFGYDEPLPTLAMDVKHDGPPALPSARAMDAMWTTAAVYQDHGVDGTLELQGAVRAASWPGPGETNTIDGETLVLHFLERPASTGDQPAQAVSRVIVRGRARLESRAWPDETRTGSPRVSYLTGDEVEYDQTTGEAFVRSPGELLLRNDAATADGTFGAAGTTLLRWGGTLAMTRIDMTRYRIVLDGGVEAIHRALDGETSTMTGDRLEAVVVRSVDGTTAGHAVDLGGAMELERLTGWGGIYVRTTERDVSCDEFVYDVASGRADVRAAPGRTVSVLDRGTATPIHHQRVEWDMAHDTITLHDGSGAGAP